MAEPVARYDAAIRWFHSDEPATSLCHAEVCSPYESSPSDADRCPDPLDDVNEVDDDVDRRLNSYNATHASRVEHDPQVTICVDRQLIVETARGIAVTISPLGAESDKNADDRWCDFLHAVLNRDSWVNLRVVYEDASA